jgi:hypothetical protein
MGGSSWSDDHYTSRVTDRSARGVATFAYDADVRSGKAKTRVHDTLNVHGKVRESRDSDAHPESTAIAVMFDVTGSMALVPSVLQKQLPKLMGLLLRKDYVKDPQVLFGAIGDYFADRVPIQVGQFESGIEMDDNLTNLYLEGGGGGSYEESYQNALYFFAHKTSIDCFEKRGKKGYLFLIGDEKPYPKSTKQELDDLFGVTVQGDVRVEEIIRACQEKYHVFFMIPRGTSHYDDPILQNRWDNLLGPDHVIKVQDAEGICESIGIVIGIVEGTTTADDITSDLADVGASKAIAKSVAASLDTLARNTSLVKTGTGDIPGAAKKSDSIERL